MSHFPMIAITGALILQEERVVEATTSTAYWKEDMAILYEKRRTLSMWSMFLSIMEISESSNMGRRVSSAAIPSAPTLYRVSREESSQ